MSQGLVENEAFVASPGLSSIPFQNFEPNATRRSTSWSDTQGLGASKIDDESFHMPLGSNMKLDDNRLRLGGFARKDGLIDADHWNRFSSRDAQASSQIPPNFSFNSVSVSSDTRLSTTPHSLPDSLRGPASGPLQGHLPESFQVALHGPAPTIRAPHVPDVSRADAAFPSFGTMQEDGMWLKNFDDLVGNKPLGLQLPYPLVGGANTNTSSLSSSLASSSAHPLSEHTFVHQQQSYPGIFPHNRSFSGPDRTIFKPTQLTPPPTASTSSTSSGSPSPFARNDAFEHNTRKDTTWKHFDANANVFRSAPRHTSDQYSRKMTHSTPHAAHEWKGVTCDSRGIAGKHEREGSRMHGNAYEDTMKPMPSHSPAISDLSASSSSGEHGEAAVRPPRHPSLVPGMNAFGQPPVPSKGGGCTDTRTGMAQKAKKKPAEEMLGMGLADVDERALQFTSRQDTKPTRMLRRQCFNCRTWRDVSAWRRSIMQVGYIVCNKCGLYEKAHKKPRPLNDRGEFIRPGKHVTKLSVARGRGRMRSVPEHSNGLSVAVMRFEEDGPASAHQV